MKSDFLRVDELEFSYNYYLSMKRYSRMALKKLAPIPDGFSLRALKETALDALEEYDMTCDTLPARKAYLQNKKELEEDDFMLPPPEITRIPLIRGVYDYLPHKGKPEVVPLTKTGEILSRFEGSENEACEGWIFYKFGVGPLSVPVQSLPVRDSGGLTVDDLLCHEVMEPPRKAAKRA